MRKPYIYLASPYSNGDPSINTHFQVDQFNLMLNDGIVIPYIPLTSHFLHVMCPRPYKDWIDYDLSVIRTMCFDACLRLNVKHVFAHQVSSTEVYVQKESSGADGEEKLFRELGLPVFYNYTELYDWARKQP